VSATTTTEPPRPPEPPASATEQAPPPRLQRPWVREVLVTAGAFVLALLIGAVLIIVSDPDVLETFTYFFARPGDAISASWQEVSQAYSALFRGALGGWSAISETLVQATPLILAGLGVSLAFRAGLFNIGAQGQVILGAMVGGYVGFTWSLPPLLHLLVVLVAGVLAGAVWGGIAGWLKARTGAHEVITTIMLNYIAIYLLGWALTTTAFQRPGRTDPISPVVDPNAQYPQLPDVRLGVGFVVALLAAAFVWWLLERSTIGFTFRAVGANADAARTAGMNVPRSYFLVMLVAGGLAGLAGVQQVSGTDFPLTVGIGGSIGFDAITVALLGRATPLGTVLAGLLFGGLNAGSVAMQLETQTPLTLAQVLQALIVLFIAAPALVQSVFRIRGGGTGQVLAKGWNA
jgi:general nucleoside transport system permease protein